MPILHGSSTDSWTLHGVTGRQDVSGPDLVTCHRDHLSITDSRGESSGISREKRAQSADRSHAFFIGSVSGAVVDDLASVGTPMTTLCLAETDTGVINWASVGLIPIPCVSRQTRR
ncbi:MAG: hypothetical protein J07HR59_00888 [Halorubrum sp. J07HR59]|jgi:hypothetical protein|nr:MAG: hypothetical protein J07HR59_00888 [Halorubrum sp. J07HR59]